MKRAGLIAVLAALVLVPWIILAEGPRPPIALHDAPRALPEISFEDASGRVVGLADFRGRIVLLNIWATWCAPCRREMPTLDRLQAQLGGPAFEVVALSIDRAGMKAVEAFYMEIAIEHLGMYVDSSGKAARALGLVGLPTTLLIGRDGRELGRLVGEASWDGPEMLAFLRRQIEQVSGASSRSGARRPAIAPQQMEFTDRN